MSQGDKFLAIAVRSGKIVPDSRRYALQHQKQLRLNEENVRVGEILKAAGLLTDAGRDEVLVEQQRLRSVRLYRLKRLSPAMPSLMGQKLLVVFFAAIGAGVATRFGVPLDPATGVAGFIALLLVTILEYRALHSATLSLVRSLILCAGVLVLVAFSYSAFTFARLDEIVTLHAASNSEAVHSWLFRVKGALVGLAAAAVTLAGYSVWKFHMLRYTQARLGLMKDVIIRVEAIMREIAKPAEERRAEAIKVVLNGLRNAIRLSLPDRMLRRFTVFSPGKDQITVMYFTPEPSSRSFRLDQVAYPDNAPGRVREAFSAMQATHFPTFLDEEAFDNMIKLAKGVDPRGWRKRYLNFPNRHDFISICGWIYAKRETLFSRDASQCLAYDGRYFEGMKGKGLTNEELSWVTFGSFIGCPVIGPDGDVASILLVAKSRNSTLEAEDLEVSIVASQLIGRVLG